MRRTERYVTISVRTWALYREATPRSNLRRKLHMMIFYGNRPVGTVQRPGDEDGKYLLKGAYVVDVLHPLPLGPIPSDYAAGEPKNVNETANTVRSARETASTVSALRGRAL